MSPALRKLLEEARAAWPKVRVDEAAFAKHVLALGELDGLRGPDLYLAFACAQHEPNAVAVFERELLPKAVVAARRIDKRGALGDDLGSRLRDTLIYSHRGPPKIAQYAGRGPLENWVRTAAMRTALNLLPRHEEVEADQIASDERLASSHPEIDFLKRRYRADFKSAFEDAVRTLSDEDVNLLRLHTLDKLSIDRLCEIYQVHRATAARRITKAREQLVLETRASLVRRLKLDGQELDSVMNLVRSNLDLSLTRLLKR
jgi:RNA polymerase sigma-70 factor (ECF subfamily)